MMRGLFCRVLGHDWRPMMLPWLSTEINIGSQCIHCKAHRHIYYPRLRGTPAHWR